MLAPPAALSATLTIIEREEGRRPAVTEVQGAVIGALAPGGRIWAFTGAVRSVRRLESRASTSLTEVPCYVCVTRRPAGLAARTIALCPSPEPERRLPEVS